MRTRRGIAVSVLGLGGSLLLALPASAQEGPEVTLEYKPSFDPEQYNTSADPEQIALTDGARVARLGSYMLGLGFHVGGPPLDICVRDSASMAEGCQVEGNLVNTRVRADLTFLYGLGRVDLRATLPMVLHQSSDFEPATGEESLGSAGVGDPRIGGRVQLVRTDNVALAGDLSFTIPTGGENFIGDAGVIVDPRLLADWRPGRVAFGASLGYRYRNQPARIANLFVSDELTWSVAGEYQLQPAKWSAGVALYGRIGLMTPATDPGDTVMIPTDLGSEEFPAEVMASTRYFISDQVAFDIGAGTAITAGYGAAPFRVLAGLQWVNREQAPLIVDTDGDGITDDDDRCVREREDVDGFQDSDGCPENDNDNDGVVDAQDKCPLDPEDLDTFQDEDGCPDLDDDADGIADATDACPKEAEDLDGFKDEDGCPELDNDGDGIVDTADKCPLEPETVNQNEDEDGCPDPARALAVVTSTGVEISDKIYFDLNRAKLQPRSYAVLDAVASVLIDAGDLRVRVEGHTDDQGEAKMNASLSQKRSEAVRTYLIKKGVDRKRLEAKGFGFSRPLVEGIDEASRSQNRRVEFVIIPADGAEPAAAPAPTTP